LNARLYGAVFSVVVIPVRVGKNCLQARYFSHRSVQGRLRVAIALTPTLIFTLVIAGILHEEDTVHPDDLENDQEEVGYVCSVWRSFTDGVSPARGRRVLALWVRGRPTARRNDSGEIIGWYGLVEDIDARKRAAGAARRAEEPPSVE
jgi:hypothetical protein